jgi:predicted acylesterase/phospholipase RssA
MSVRRKRAGVVLALLIVLAGGCAEFHYPVNARLTPDSPNAGYRFPDPPETRAGDPRDRLFVCIAMSGGGTRAAAFAYGVLQALRDVRIDHNGLGSLLDEVDCLSGISGGSFAAAGYVVLRERFFSEFPQRFLEPNVQARLALTAANPLNLVRLMSPYLSRIDLAAELYGRLLFGDTTFRALDPDRRPFLIVNATNMADGAPFEFTQDYFDFLGSDLASVPIARAVAASSAFPFLLSPITVWSYPGPYSDHLRFDVAQALHDRETNLFRYRWAQNLQDLTTRDAKYIHLLDGGLADNIGARPIINAFSREHGFVRRRMNDDRIRRFVVLLVNARTSPAEHLTRSPRGPGIAAVGLTTATTPMENFSSDTVELMQRMVTDDEKAQQSIAACNARLSACTPPPPPLPVLPAVRGCVVELSFEGLEAADRDELLSYPTSFSLTAAQVKKLVEAGPTLLRRSQDFQRLLRALRGEPAIGEGIGERDRCS